jgi:hypothetical protein
MGRAYRLLLTLSCLVCFSAAAHAGNERPLAAGTLVRVTAPSLSRGRIEGRLLSASEHQIVLVLPDSEPRTIPRNAVTKLQWSPGYQRHPIPGAIVGGLLGGAFFGAAVYAMCDAATCSVSLPAVGIGAALGALPGAGIGALIRTREWKDAEPSRVQFSIAPVRGKGVAAKLTLRF